MPIANDYLLMPIANDYLLTPIAKRLFANAYLLTPIAKPIWGRAFSKHSPRSRTDGTRIKSKKKRMTQICLLFPEKINPNQTESISPKNNNMIEREEKRNKLKKK